MMSRLRPLLILTIIVASLSTAPAQARRRYYTRKQRCLMQMPLIASIFPTTGSSVTGTVQFTPLWQRGKRGWHVCDVHIKATISGLSPGMHGFHIHTYGDLSDMSGSSTGGHFANPYNRETIHGYPDSPSRHWGDFGNLEADGSGTATYNRVDTLIGLRGILGRGMTIHSGEDQGPPSQPSGGSGSRVAFGVIGIKNPEI